MISEIRTKHSSIDIENTTKVIIHKLHEKEIKQQSKKTKYKNDDHIMQYFQHMFCIIST